MKTDKMTKILLTVIAAGLWANAMTSWLKPASALADSELSIPLSSIERSVNSINSDLGSISSGMCFNRKICSSN